MRIGLISREYPPDTGWGGIGAYTFQHAHSLMKLGHDVQVICLTKRDVECEHDPAPTVETDEASGGTLTINRVVWGHLLTRWILILATKPNTHHAVKAALALWQKVLTLHNEKPFDVLEAPDHLAEAIFPALTKLAPLVIRIHTPFSKFVQEGYHNLANAFDNQMVGHLERLSMLQADLLSSPSVDMAKYVAGDTGISLDEIAIVRNPVDIKVFTPDGEKASIPGHKPEEKIVFFAGRLEARKGIHYLIDAIPTVLESHPQTRFVIVGADTKTAAGAGSVLEELKAKLRANLKNAGDLEKINFISHVALSDMPKYYRLADICCVPSLYDNAPYTVLESLASGKPVIGSTAGGTPEYIDNGVDGLHVNKADARDLASKINLLLADDVKRADFAKQSRHIAETRYSTEVIAKEAVASYQKATALWQEKKAAALYKQPPERLVRDLDAMLYSYHENLDELAKLVSIRYRMRPWRAMLLTRPKLFAASLFLVVSKGCAGILGKPQRFMDYLKQLETRIESAKLSG